MEEEGKLQIGLEDLYRLDDPHYRDKPIYVKLVDVLGLIKQMIDDYPKEWEEDFKNLVKGSPCTDAKNTWFIDWLIAPLPLTRIPPSVFYYCTQCGEDVNPNDKSSHRCNKRSLSQ